MLSAPTCVGRVSDRGLPLPDLADGCLRASISWGHGPGVASIAFRVGKPLRSVSKSDQFTGFECAPCALTGERTSG